jgi:hypothetical protein
MKIFFIILILGICIGLVIGLNIGYGRGLVTCSKLEESFYLSNETNIPLFFGGEVTFNGRFNDSYGFLEAKSKVS